MQIAIGLQVGYTSEENRVGGVFQYLLYDTFATDRGPGAINGTNAEPGPGMRWVLDTSNKLSLSGGKASYATGGVSGDPALRWQPLISRTPGRIAIGEVALSTAGVEFGVDQSYTLLPSDSFRLHTTAINVRSNTSTVIAVGALPTPPITYKLALVSRANGMFYFIKGGVYADWSMVWVSSLGAYSWHPCAMPTVSTFSGNVSDVKVPAARWLPAPIASDGFSAWGTTDGLGHFEGLNGEALGQGGGGKAWTANIGTWGVSSGRAVATALSGGQAIATLDAGKADMLISVNCTLVSGTMSLIVRWVDSNNYIQLRLTTTNCQLVKIVAGVSTTVGDTAYTYSAGAELRLIVSGTAFRRFYNNAAIGGESTIADAAVQSATIVGLRTDAIANTFDNLRVYARGSGGEYAQLDSY